MRVVFTNPWVQAAFLLLALAGVTMVGFLLSSVLIPLFFAFIVAYIFDPVIDYIETHGMSRMAAILLLVIGLILVALLLPLFVIPSIVDQGEALIASAKAPQPPDIVDRALSALPLEHWIKEAGWAAPDEEIDEPRILLVTKVGELVRDNATDFLRANARELLGVGQTATRTAAEFFNQILTRVMNSLLLFGNFALFAFVAIYLLKDYDHIIEEAGDLVPKRFRTDTYRIFRQIDAQLRAWLRGQAFVCLCLGVMYAVGFTICGVPFGLVLAFFGGLVSFVPFLGLALTIGPAVLLTLLNYGFDWHVLGVVATLLIAQGLEGNVITPRIMGQQVGLAPVWVILAIMVFGSTLGFIGLLLAVPIAAVLKVLVVESYELYRQSEFFTGKPEPQAKPLPAPAKRKAAPRAKPQETPAEG